MSKNTAAAKSGKTKKPSDAGSGTKAALKAPVDKFKKAPTSSKRAKGS